MKKNLIKRLKARYDLLVKAREAREAKDRPLKERMQEIFSAPRFAKMDFWCRTCGKDCVGVGHRQVSVINDKWPTAWFIGRCPKGHKVLRRITDKDQDPYYFESMFLKKQRHEYADAVLTPNDPRFKVLYPKQYKELMKKHGQKT